MVRRSPRRPRRAESLRLADYSDRDLLGLLADVGDNNGWASNHDVALRAFGNGISRDDDRRKHAERCVSVRLSWMRRYGVVERHPAARRTWRLSATGADMLAGQLRGPQVRAIEAAGEEQLLHLATAFAARSYEAGATGRTMMRRAWQYGQARQRGR